ncbi:polyketide synthase dehydratase-domain-containing protein [Astrocystis sublimbata]|nr:polyketide synthase dehydratase-domain-containing protein [Astrocystis sublimbata]
MYALHMAVNAIRNGDCDGAFVAAANWISDPSMQIVMDKLGALSPTSRCHTFDACADGYARGEGYAALYLKKSSLAILDANPIRAMIRGTAVNANGRTGGITRPSVDGQEDVIRRTYQNAGRLPFADTAFFECHGTGTQAGDPLEVEAIGNVFASSRSDTPDDRLLIGSIKPSLGHTEGASAIASIMKVVLSLEAGRIPPTFGVTTLNPKIDFAAAKVEVVRDSVRPWPQCKLRRASVNSFGFGGANGHCLIDHVNVVLPDYVKPGITNRSKLANSHRTNGSSADHNNQPSVLMHSPITHSQKKLSTADAMTRDLVLLPFSAHNTTSLALNIKALSEVLGQWSLADVAYTLSYRRSKLQHRSYRIVDRHDPTLGLAVECPVFTSPIDIATVAYVFTGQGAQWHAMGAQILEYAVFRTAIEHLDFVLAQLPNPLPWHIAHIISGACDENIIHLPQVSQVVCTAVQIGLIDLLSSWSIRPTVVVGHSSGEMAAAYASGRITAAEAIAVAHARGQTVSNNTQIGAMLAVGLGSEQVAAEYLGGKEEHITIAALNSPNSTTLSGDADAIDSLSSQLTADGIFNRKLRTGGNAYHSHHMRQLGGGFVDRLSDYLKVIEQLGLSDHAKRYPPIPWVSSVVPKKPTGTGDMDPSYWRCNLESPVRFSEAVENMLQPTRGSAPDILVEIGPHPALKGPLDQILKHSGKSVQYSSTLRRNEDGRISMLNLAGKLFGLNAAIDVGSVSAIDGQHEYGTCLIQGCTAVDLPTYKYTYGPISYCESRASKEFRLRDIVRHDILGSRVVGASRTQPQWRNVLRVKDLPWLSDHRLIPDAVFPAAGFVAMAAEAASQIHAEKPSSRDITGFSMVKVDIGTALKIPEDDDGVEIVLGIDFIDTESARETSWAKFTVSSWARDSGNWTVHCTGRVKPEVSQRPGSSKMSTNMDARSPDIASWYDKFADIGIGYGPMFRPLSKILVDPNQNLARASVALDMTTKTIQGGESNYHVHPTAIDGAIQLGLIACYGGQVERANVAYVPVHFSRLYLRAGCEDTSAMVTARGRTQGLRNAYVQLQVVDRHGEALLEVDTLKLTRFQGLTLPESTRSTKAFNSPFTRLCWKPDFRNLGNQQARQLFPAPEENISRIAALERADTISCLVVADIYDRFVRDEGGPQPKGELSHWLSWVRKCVEEDSRRNMVEAAQLDPAKRSHLLQKLCAEAGSQVEAMTAKCLHENIDDILHERTTGIDVLISRGLLTPLYESGHLIAGSHPQLFNILDLAGHSNPNLRIIEVGAGTGAATRTAMRALVGANGMKRYADYTFTDISAGFFGAAREFMSEYRDIKYSVLDIEQDPMANGYEGIYDIVLACEAIHVTESLDKVLKHCRSLLKPGGKLIIAETTHIRVAAGLLYGTFTGYWLGAFDGRTEGPFMNQSAWDTRLLASGFSGVDIILDDYPSPQQSTSVIVSTRLEETDKSKNHGVENDQALIYLLHSVSGPTPLLGRIVSELEGLANPYRAVVLGLDAPESVPKGARVIAFLNAENDLFDPEDSLLKAYQILVRNAQSMVWVTSCGVIQGRDPRGGFMLGLLRAIATENPASKFLSIDIDISDFDAESGRLAKSIIACEASLQEEVDGNGTHGDRELAWQGGCMRVSRVVPDGKLGPYAEPTRTPAHLGCDILPSKSQGPLCADFETPGILASLYFRPYTELLQHIPATFIDVEVAAVGLSWSDLAFGSGPFDAFNHDRSSEYTGVVVRTGSQVVGFSVGDRVYGVGKVHFGTHTRVPASFAQKLQPVDDILHMATMPLVYMTALYALEHIANLREGQTVLIQSATGGLGLAAIQVARMKGAEVFATAGTASEIAFLVDDIGLSKEKVLASRDSVALSHAANGTKKGGFDVILSTGGGGDLLRDSLDALAPLGRLLDLSRVDVLDSNDIGPELFQRGTSFSSIDLNIVLDNNPELGAHLMKSVDELYRAGHISPIRPFSVADVAQLSQTLADFSKGTHLGKTVVSFLDPESSVKVVRVPPMAKFDSEGRYIITGGFGGLGRSIISWMADRGARDFIVLSRSGATKPEARQLIDRLAARGVSIEGIVCDISKRADVARAMEGVATQRRSIKGLVHAALSLSDLSFDKLTIDQFRSGVAAKTLGTINLHDALHDSPLDFFVMLTSTESIWAPPTQSAYIAATNFQENFARFRRHLGLPASTVAYGLVKDVESQFKMGSFGTDDMYTRNRALTTTEWHVLVTLEPAFLDAAAIDVFGQRHDPLSTANYFTCLDPAALAKLTSPNVPRWHSDSRVAPLMRAINDAQASMKNDNDSHDSLGHSSAPASSAARLRQAFDEAVKEGPSGRDGAIALVTEGIMTAITEMLFTDVRNVNPNKSIAGHGVDSLIAAELRHWFHQALRTNIQMTDLLDGAMSIKDMAENTVDQVLGRANDVTSS